MITQTVVERVLGGYSAAGTAVDAPAIQSAEELRMRAVRAILTALTAAAIRHDHEAVRNLSASLETLKEVVA